MARLGVNIKPIAQLRQLANDIEPDPVTAAVYAELGGADGIVCPVKEEFQPVTERDVQLLKEIVKTHFTLQIPPTEKMITLALKISPDMVMLIPGKKPGTTEGGGLDVLGHGQKLQRIIQELHARDIVVSLLVDPNVHQVKAAAKIRADYIELHMGQYVLAQDLNERSDQLENIASVALAASKLELGVAAGQGINYHNVSEISGIQYVEEINIGRAIAAKALWMGIENAVRDMIALVR